MYLKSPTLLNDSFKNMQILGMSNVLDCNITLPFINKLGNPE